MITGIFCKQFETKTTCTEMSFNGFDEFMDFLNQHELDRPIRSNGSLSFENYDIGDTLPVRLMNVKGMTDSQLRMLVD